MKFNPRLQADVMKYMDYTIIVEGKKDVISLNSIGFEKVYEIHKDNMTLQDRLEQIIRVIGKKEKVCILTDLDKKGKILYFKLKEMFQERGIKTDSTLRGLLLVGNINHIEQIADFVKKAHAY